MLSDLWFFEGLKCNGIFLIKAVILYVQMYMYAKHISRVIEAITKSSCQRHKITWLQFKEGCFSSYTKGHAPLFKIAQHVIKNILYKQISIWTLVTAVTTQTSGPLRDFALYSLEDLAFIRTCTQGISITWLPLSVVRK